jgi:hypothetical protein
MRLAFAILIGLPLLGCSGEPPYKGDKRYAVQGTVTYNDEPVDNAMISFTGENPTGQHMTGAPILGGKYSIEADKGPNAGKYQVQVRWSKPTGKKRKDTDTGEMIDEVKEVLPSKFNANSELRAEVGSGSNTFDFELKGPALK